MSDTVQPSDTQVNAARGIVEINQRLGEETAEWLWNLATTRLPTDPADQSVWAPLPSKPVERRRPWSWLFRRS